MGRRAQQESAQAENRLSGKNSSTLSGEVGVKKSEDMLKVSDSLMSRDLVFRISSLECQLSCLDLGILFLGICPVRDEKEAFDARRVSVHCFILSGKNFLKLAEKGTGKFQN